MPAAAIVASASRRLVALAITLPLAGMPGPARAAEVHVRDLERVLVLHSYSPDFAWTRSQQEGVDAVFGPLAAEYDLRIEYLDAVHHPELLKGRLVLDLLRARLAGHRFRAVLTSDNAAFDFARAHRAELFPGVPIVFMGVNGYHDGLVRGEGGITGVAEDSDLAGTLAVLLRLWPETRRVVFPGMADDLTYRAIRSTVARDLAALPPEVTATFPEYPHVDAALEDVRKLPPDSAIVVMANMRTADGEGISSQRVVELVSAAAPVPVFTNWDFVVGHGAVGGSVISGVEQGRLAAQLAVRVLRGERPESIPVHRAAGKALRFDHRQLERFRIPASRLPAGAVVLFGPEQTLRISREAAWFVGVSFAVLLGVTASLVVAVRRRRVAERDLRAANERFEAILRAATDYSVIGTDLDGRIVVFSEGAQLLLGYAAQEVMGKPVAELLHDPAEVASRATELRVPAGFDVFVAAARRGGTETREWTYRRRDGSTLRVALTVAAMRGPDGAQLGFIGIGRDVTAQKRLEEKLAQSLKMESIGLLAGGVAHDFNNLLTPILGHVALLLDELPPGDDRAEALREIQGAAERASQLTRQLLAFSRKQMLELKTLSLGDVVRRAESMLRRTLGETIRIEVAVAPDLEPVRADAGQMDQVLLNLAINARDAMPEGGLLHIGARNVAVDAAHVAQQPDLKPGRYALLEVSDTGAGMPAEVRRHLFEPFFTTKERGKGTGLGLSTVYGIVKQHGGTIGVYSEPGKGSSFRVYLPAVQGLTAPHEGPRPAPAARPGGRETVLVVEDSEAVRHVASDMLERLGYTVLAAPDGEHAIALARGSGPIHLLLTDVVLPTLDGKQVAARLREGHPDLRVLYMSGYAADVIVHHGAVDEGVDFIPKPLSLEGLARKVRDVLDTPPERAAGAPG